MASQQNNQIRFMAKIFYTLSDPIRLEILEYLRSGEKCVCEIVPHLNFIQPIVSRHLKILKDAGIIKCRKDGTKRFYSTVDPQIYAVIDNITPKLNENLTQEILKNIHIK
ncbi:MAG: winged helix-turn-helix transcriptional regulator [Crenarchaeota archaeon]|nr:winged helix-turn-helix transcriptional regulator [Thermoproteota archaeon]